jgi:lipoprotein-anchoring transpeptidase ErfK/SrfK
VIVKAAAADPHRTVRLSLLGHVPARLDAKPGNPAVGVVRFVSRTGSPRIFALTLVARTPGTPSLAITRTVVVIVRTPVVSLVGPGAVSRWAYVLEGSTARATPSTTAAPVARVRVATSDGQPNVVRLLAQEKDAAGRTWVRVALTVLPNGRTGWVLRSDLSSYRLVETRLVIDTHRFTVTLYRNGRRVFRAPAGVGLPASPTPRGSFYIREKLTDFHNAAYGPVAFGTNARSPVLTDWPGGGVVGIHGTNEPSRLPGRISHGCVRLRNADVLRLERLLPLGTPVTIR